MQVVDLVGEKVLEKERLDQELLEKVDKTILLVFICFTKRDREDSVDMKSYHSTLS